MDANSDVMFTSQWRFAYASVIGNSHVEAGLPCQDFCDVADFGDFSVSVVCDGAGSCENSHHGAKQVVQFCLYQFSREVKIQEWHQQKNLPTLEQWTSVARQTLRKVMLDLERYSVDSGYPFKSLACTVIVGISLPGGLLATHIGDGRAGYCDDGGNWHPIIKPFHGNEANETVFITSDIWTEEGENFYINSSLVEGDVKAFCLLTDGCEKSAFECNLFDAEKEIYYDPNRPYPLFFNSNVIALPKIFEGGATQDEVNSSWKNFGNSVPVGTSRSLF